MCQSKNSVVSLPNGPSCFVVLVNNQIGAPAVVSPNDRHAFALALQQAQKAYE